MAEPPTPVCSATPGVFISDSAQLGRFWWLRSLAAGAVAAIVDLSVASLAIHVLQVPKLNAITAGVISGALVGFVLNRLAAFSARGPWKAQFLRYAAVVSVEILLHRALVNVLLSTLAWPWLVAKYASDALIFGALHLVALKVFVFAQKTRAPHASAP